MQHIHFIQSPLCTCCGVPFPGSSGTNRLCGECIISPPPFTVARSLGRYETVLMEVIHKFKYRGKIAAGKVLGTMMASFDYSEFPISEYSLVMPVPLHPRRLRERGFNQSLILSRELARTFSLTLDFTSLRRHIYREPQVNVKREKRESNVRGVFQLRDEDKVKGEKIILVDDVYTSGSTVRECCRVLKKCGVADVSVLTVARTMYYV